MYVWMCGCICLYTYVCGPVCICLCFLLFICILRKCVLKKIHKVVCLDMYFIDILVCGTCDNFQNKNILDMGFVGIFFFLVKDLMFFCADVNVNVYVASCVCFVWILCLCVFFNFFQYNSNINLKQKYIVIV